MDQTQSGCMRFSKTNRALSIDSRSVPVIAAIDEPIESEIQDYSNSFTVRDFSDIDQETSLSHRSCVLMT